MPLADMKLPKKTEKELKAESLPVLDNQDRYPWGLQLRFEKDQIEKLPTLPSYKVGDRVMIQAEATITGVRMSERQNGKEDHSVEMQIEKIGCEPFKKKPMEHMGMREYRAEREKKA